MRREKSRSAATILGGLTGEAMSTYRRTKLDLRSVEDPQSTCGKGHALFVRRMWRFSMRSRPVGDNRLCVSVRGATPRSAAPGHRRDRESVRTPLVSPVSRNSSFERKRPLAVTAKRRRKIDATSVALKPEDHSAGV